MIGTCAVEKSNKIIIISLTVTFLILIGGLNSLGREVSRANSSFKQIIAPNPDAFNQLRTLIANVVSGTSRARFAVLGDSTEMGRGGGTGPTNQVGARLKTPSFYLSVYLNASAVPARADAVFGNSNAGSGSLADLTAYNPSITFGSDWSFTQTKSIGSGFFTNSGSSALTYAPDRAADRFDVLYAMNADGASFTVSDASGTLATINTAPTSGANTVGKTTVVRASASLSPVTITRTGGGTLYLSGIDPWNSTLPEFCVLPLAVSGAVAITYVDTSNTFTAKNQLNHLSPDFSYIEYGLNEKNNGVSLEQFSTNLSALVTQQLANSGGVALGISAPGQLGSSWDLTPGWRDAISGIASNYGIALVNHYTAFGSYEKNTPIYADIVHLKSPGYARKGRLLADMVLQ